MKTLTTTLSLVAALATGAWAQGFVNIANTTASLAVYTLNYGGGTTKTGTAPSSFYYDVLFNDSTVTTIDSSLQDLAAAGWSDSGITGVNGTGGLGAGRISAVNTAATTWPCGVQQAFVVVGWSASLGSTWGQVEAELSGAHFQSGQGWTGGNFVPGSYLGYTTLGIATSGQDAGTAAALFSTTSTADVPVPVSTPTILYPIVPEPGTLAIAGLGAMALLLLGPPRQASPH